MITANVTLYVVPIAIARTREKLDAVFAAWAELRQQSTMVVRVSGPVTLPGKELDVWIFETTCTLRELLASDLSLKARGVVVLRLDGEDGWAEAQVHTRDRPYDDARVDRPDQLESLAARALGSFVGPLDVAPGWLAPWVEAHAAIAEVRVVRWNASRTKSPEWPFGYGKPSDRDWRGDRYVPTVE